MSLDAKKAWLLLIALAALEATTSRAANVVLTSPYGHAGALDNSLSGRPPQPLRSANITKTAA